MSSIRLSLKQSLEEVREQEKKKKKKKKERQTRRSLDDSDGDDSSNNNNDDDDNINNHNEEKGTKKSKVLKINSNTKSDYFIIPSLSSFASLASLETLSLTTTTNVSTLKPPKSPIRYTRCSLHYFNQILFSNHNHNYNNNNNKNMVSSSSTSSSSSCSSTISTSKSTKSTTLSFQNIYEIPSSIAKQLEIRWFHSNPYLNNTNTTTNNDNDNDMIINHYHKMPFLRRSLSYIKLSHLLSKYHNEYNNHNITTTKSKTRTKPTHANTNKNKRDESIILLQCPIIKKRRLNHNDNDHSKKSLFFYQKMNRPKQQSKQCYKSKNNNNNNNNKNNNQHNHIIIKSKQNFYKQIKKASLYYGKSFPPYRPYENNIWNVPLMYKNAFELFCERQLGKEMTKKYIHDLNRLRRQWNDIDNNNNNNNNATTFGDKVKEDDDDIGVGSGGIINIDRRNDNLRYHTTEGTATTTSHDRHEKMVLRQIEKIWDELSSTEKMYWIQEEAWDKARYHHEKYIYDTAKKLGVDAVDNYCGRIMDWGENINLCTYGKCQCREEGRLCKKHLINVLSRVGNAIYYFVYYDSDEMQIQTEHRNDRRCPFCTFNAGSNIGIMIHCKTTHGDTLAFHGGIDEDNNFHVIIRPMECIDTKQPNEEFFSISTKKKVENVISKSCIFLSSKYYTSNDSSSVIEGMDDIPIELISDHQTAKTNVDDTTRKRKIRLLEQRELAMHPKAKSQYILSENEDPIRQYYHSKTNLPISRDEWDKDEDSDDDEDDQWIHQLGERLINDLGDISYQEKIFMNIWNKFIKSYVVIADMKVPAKCQEFIMLHHKQLLQNDLRMLLLLHFFNLWDNGLLPSKKIIFLMDFFDELTMNLKDKGFNSLEVDSDSTDAEEKKTDHQSTK